MGIGSRSLATRWVIEGRVRVNGRVVTDPDQPVRQGADRIDIDGEASASADRLVVMLNKPRGLVTSVSDEQGRETVYRCLADSGLPWLAPVGRLDKASEGLLLFTNDPAWSARITDPAHGQPKTYHVQIDRVPDAALLTALVQGVQVGDERLAVTSARCLRHGNRHAWLEILLHEGRNRQIRRLLTALGVSVLRLVRVAVGRLALGDLPKGHWRRLSAPEADALAAPSGKPNVGKNHNFP